MTTRGLQHKIVLNIEQLRKKSLSFFNIQSPFFIRTEDSQNTSTSGEKEGISRAQRAQNLSIKPPVNGKSVLPLALYT